MSGALPPAKRYCFIDITIGDEPSGKIFFELFHDKVPQTCGNFQALCDGNDGKTVPGDDSVAMHYKGSTFHRVIKSFMLQGGDYTNHNGTGGFSIHGAEFADESFDTVPLNKPGLLCMANRGPNTNGSQFFITTAKCSHLDGKHVVFGKVVGGMNTVRKIEHSPTGAQDKPQSPVVIADCGSLDALPEAGEVLTDPHGDVANDWPDDCEPPLGDAEKLEVAEAVRTIGNQCFGKQLYADAISKYEKALRYLDGVIPTSASSAGITTKRLACHSNSAMAYLKLEKFSLAFAAADEAVKVDAKNTKALFRRASASIGMKDYERAEADCHAALLIEPDNADVTALKDFCLGKRGEEKAKQKAAMKKMFA